MTAPSLQLEDAQATATKVYLRGILGGVAGGGKSWTALMLATEFARREDSFVGVIESERGRSTHYADQFPHKVIVLPDTSVETYIAALGVLHKAGCRAVIIDSLTHAWEGGVKDAVEKAKPQFGGNQWSAWSVGKAKQRKLIDLIMRYPGFVICTCRMKTATEIAQEGKNKGKPVEVGMRFVQEDGIIYEFDWAAQMQLSPANPQDHDLTVLKSVLGSYLPVGATTTNPGPELAEAIFKWLDRGGTKPAAPARVTGNATQRRAELAAAETPAPRASAPSHFAEEEVEPEFEYHVEDNRQDNSEPQGNGTGGPPPQDLPGAPTESGSKPQPTGKSWNVPERSAQDKGHPVTDQQIASLKKLGKALGYGEDVPTGMTGAQAGQLITRLSSEYGARRGSGNLGAGGGPGINQRAAAERAQSQARPTATSATATATREDDPFGDDDE